MSDRETLKPCPFCGSEAERFTIEEPGDNFGGDVICCTRCQASSHVEFGYKENLASRWNTRAPHITPQATPVPQCALEADVVRLVIAARIVAFEDQSPEALHELDRASEAFAERVPWDDDPTHYTHPTASKDATPAPQVSRELLCAALNPFATFAETFVDEEGWTGPMRQERIVDWFGPSDFRAALSAIQLFASGYGETE